MLHTISTEVPIKHITAEMKYGFISICDTCQLYNKDLPDYLEDLGLLSVEILENMNYPTKCKHDMYSLLNVGLGIVFTGCMLIGGSLFGLGYYVEKSK